MMKSVGGTQAAVDLLVEVVRVILRESHRKPQTPKALNHPKTQAVHHPSE